MPSKTRPLFLGLLALLALSGCSDPGPEADVEESTSSTAAPDSYSSEVDGVSVRWPEGWQRSGPLDARPISNNVELLVLTTFEEAVAGQCAPDPDAAMGAMGENDALFMLRASDGAGDPRPMRPEILLTEPGEPGSGGCRPEGVEVWRVPFQEHNRPYEAFVAARSPLGEDRRAEIQEIWANLRLEPIADGRTGAEVGRPYWHSLYTHCGIRATTFDGREWVVDPPVPDGEGNPPRSWNDPDEHGTITLENESSAVFTSRDGERTATFRPRTAQDPPLPGCA